MTGSAAFWSQSLKAGNASTLDVVQGIKKLLPKVAATLPPELKIQPLADQSIFVRAAINGVVREAIIAACLTGLDDPDLPWQLAQHADHRDLHSALDSDVPSAPSARSAKPSTS